MSAPTFSLAAITVLATALLTGWTLPPHTTAATPAAPRPVACEAGVPADYLLYHALVSPHAALTPPRSDASRCTPSSRRVHT